MSDPARIQSPSAQSAGNIRVRKYADLGAGDFGWLNAHYHFSFSRYYDPAYTGFGNLLVINDDIVAPGRGFGMHPHNDMEIITYVRQGAISHQDSLGNAGRTGAGEVQVMSAGTGIVHAEHNHETVPTKLYQIWITPREEGVAPRWEQRSFPREPAGDRLALLVSGYGEDRGSGALYIHQDARIHGGRLRAGQSLTHPLASGRSVYVLVSEGDVTLNGIPLSQGDGAAVMQAPALEFNAQKAAEILVIDIAEAPSA